MRYRASRLWWVFLVGWLLLIAMYATVTSQFDSFTWAMEAISLAGFFWTVWIIWHGELVVTKDHVEVRWVTRRVIPVAEISEISGKAC